MEKTKNIQREIIRARVNKTERAALELLAEREAMTMSEAMRDLVRTRARELGLWDLARTKAEGIKAAAGGIG